MWWYISVGATVITLGLFGVKTYEWVHWTRVPLEPQMSFLQIFCPTLFVALGVMAELGWLPGTTHSTDTRKRGLGPSGRRRRSGRPPPGNRGTGAGAR